MCDYIQMSYNPTRKHTKDGMLLPVGYEMKQKKMNQADVRETRGTSLFTIQNVLPWQGWNPLPEAFGGSWNKCLNRQSVREIA